MEAYEIIGKLHNLKYEIEKISGRNSDYESIEDTIEGYYDDCGPTVYDLEDLYNELKDKYKSTGGKLK